MNSSIRPLSILALSSLLPLIAAAGRSTPAAGTTGPAADEPPAVGRILGDEQARLAAEAAGSYREIVAILMRGDDAEVLGRLLDDGRPIPKRKQIRLAEQRADLKRTREFVAKVRAIEGRPGEPLVERRREVMADGTEVAVILVTYELRGTKALGSEIHAGPKSVGTVAADGNLVVYLKQINGKWYWNPFGW